MTAANRRRGADAERKVVAWLRATGWPDTRRYLAGDGRQPGDIDWLPGVVVEVKDRVDSAWPTWQRQALAEADWRQVVAVVRRSRGIRDPGVWPCRWTLDGGESWQRGELADFVAALGELHEVTR